MGDRTHEKMKIRRIFEAFDPYGWETPSHEIAEKVGLRTEQIVRLDTNTSPFPPLPELRLLSKVARRSRSTSTLTRRISICARALRHTAGSTSTGSW